MNKAFLELLQAYMPDPEALASLQLELEHLYYKINEQRFEEEKRFQDQPKEVNKKIDTIEEKHYVLNEMSKEAFDKFYPRYQKEKRDTPDQLGNYMQLISNLLNSILKMFPFSSKLATV